jgi:serine/threonine-protein kinase TTK/MPS1
MSTSNTRNPYYTHTGKQQQDRNALQSSSQKASADLSRNQDQEFQNREDSEDDIEPPTLSDLGRSVLEQKEESPERKATSRSSVLRTPTQESGTNLALSLRVKRMGLMGAPLRRAKPSPESENNISSLEVKSPSQSQKHLPVSTEPLEADTSHSQPAHMVSQIPQESPVSKTVTTSAGASSKPKKKRAYFIVNKKVYPQIGGKIGTGGSSEVYCVKGDHPHVFALKKVRLTGLDEDIFIGYKLKLIF